MIKIGLIFLILFVHQNIVQASTGDEAPDYLMCYIKCTMTKCQPNITQTYDNVTETTKQHEEPTLFEKNQPFYRYYTGWDCVDECRYDCMWERIENLTATGNLTEMPQFGGKWPFVRILFIQEPMSALASFINFIVNIVIILQFRKQLPGYAAFRYLWYSFGLTSLGYWACAIMFHTRDSLDSLFADCFGAFFFLIFYLSSFIIRTLWVIKSYKVKFLVVAIVSLLFYSYYTHVDHMANVLFDIDYNMQVMLFVNGLNSLCWLLWSGYQYYYLKHKYVWRCAASIFLLNFFMILEFLEFEPLFYAIDSHCLWHFSTAIIPFYWYKFLVDDNERINNERNKLEKIE